MNRKLFLSSLLPASAMLYAFKSNISAPLASENIKHKKPPYLKKGDIIAINLLSRLCYS